MPPSVKNRTTVRPSDPIGVFDSGVGGLSTLRHLERILPHERFVFLADQDFVPYGEKSPEQLVRRCVRVTEFLRERNVKMVVVACNTATCYAIGHLRAHFPVPFVGTVPAIKTACLRSEHRSVAVLSTPATARSDLLKTLIRDHAGTCRVTRIGCAGLEEAVENGSLNGGETRRLVKRYIARARKAGADQIVLGCTHYPFLKERFREIYPVPTVDSAPAIARHARRLLRSAGIQRRTGTSVVTYYTTGDPKRFSRVASQLLRRTIRSKKAEI